MTTSPDVAGYYGLTLTDPDPQDIAEAGIAALQAAIPGLVLAEGYTETALIEALAVEAAGDRLTANGIPGLLYELVVKSLGVPRDTGAPPQAYVGFTAADTLGHTVPAGTTVRLYPTSGADPVDFVTRTAAVITAGTVGAAPVIADGVSVTTDANGTPAGTLLTVVDAIGYLQSAGLVSPVTPGRLAEASDQYLARASTALQRLTSTITRDVDVVAYLAGQPGISRAYAIGLYDPSQPGTAPGGALGHMTAAVAAPGGSGLSAPGLASLAAQLTQAGNAGVQYHVVNADVTAVNVALTVHRLASATDAAVAASVTTALQQYLSSDNWTWGAPVTLAQITAVADRATGVDVVLSIATPSTDLTLPGRAPLAQPGTISVTVTSG